MAKPPRVGDDVTAIRLKNCLGCRRAAETLGPIEITDQAARDERDAFVAEIEEHADTVSGVDVPGMFG